MGNAANTQEKVGLATKRKEKLEAEGAFRTLLQKEGVKGRGGLPNWSPDVRLVDTAMGGVVYDTQGEKHGARKVLPVPAASSGVIEVFRGG